MYLNTVSSSAAGRDGPEGFRRHARLDHLRIAGQDRDVLRHFVVVVPYKPLGSASPRTYDRSRRPRRAWCVPSLAFLMVSICVPSARQG